MDAIGIKIMINFRLATEEDFPELVKLRNRLMKQPQDEAMWRWILNGPEHQMLTTLIAENSIRIAGMFTSFPLSLYVNGQTIPGARANELMIDPDYRGQKLAAKLIEYLTKFVLEEKPMIYGFANQKSYKAVEKYGVWHSFDEIVPLAICPINIPRLLQIRLKIPGWLASIVGHMGQIGYQLVTSKPNASMSITAIDTTDERLDSLWEQAKQPFKIAAVRDRKYIHWRYLESPNNYHVYGVEEDGKIIGIIAFIIRDMFGYRAAFLMDLITLPERDDAKETLLYHLRISAEEDSADLILALNNVYHWQSLKRAGFIRIPGRFSPHETHLTYKIRESVPGIDDASNWLITWGDHDFV